jgi:hypothetical protein
MTERTPAGQSGWSTFLVEHYWPGVTAAAFDAAAQRVRESAEALAGEGIGVRFLHSTLVPEDEAAFCVLSAESHAIVEETYRRAGVGYERVLDAIEAGQAAGSPG